MHKRDSQVCILGEGGEVVLEPRVRTQWERLGELLSKRPKARVLLEASLESKWVARYLEEMGHEEVVADPNFAPMYATRSHRVKTDKRDARNLAEACKLGRTGRRTALRTPQAHDLLKRARWSGLPPDVMGLPDKQGGSAGQFTIFLHHFPPR